MWRLTLFLFSLVKEWVLASRVAVPDDLGLRLHGRTKIRPAQQSNKRETSWVGDVGYIVDAWWHDGWWEGIVVRKESEANYHVYFPGMSSCSYILHLKYRSKPVNHFSGP